MNDIRSEDFPHSCLSLLEVIGVETMVAITQGFGGMQIYIPKIETVLKNAMKRAVGEEFNGKE